VPPRFLPPHTVAAACRAHLLNPMTTTSSRLTPKDPEKLDPRALLAALKAVKRGDFTVRLPEGLSGVDSQISDAFNDMVDTCQSFTEDLAQLSEAIGEGRTKQRVSRAGRRGSWAT